ncbi:MAG TPA: Rnase Y domain-containing protein, partial [Bacteroidales bacterium]|nr:Rnase Y domain-containing protein [Bacteroidales bacterium]
MLFYIIAGIAGLGVGILVSTTFLRKALEKKSLTILEDAKEKGEIIKKEKILQAKEKFLQLKTDHEQVINEKNLILSKAENKLKQREQLYTQRMDEFQKKQKELTTIKTNLGQQLELVSKKQEELQKIHSQEIERLEALSGLSADEAKEQLIENLKNEAKTEAMVHIKDIVDEAKLTANMEAKKV